MALTLIGLGDGGHERLTLGALEALRRASTRLARTRTHAAIQWLESEGGVTFDAALDAPPAPDNGGAGGDSMALPLSGAGGGADIAGRVLAAARADDTVYAVPGHPLWGDPSALTVYEQARAESLPVRLIYPADAPPPLSDYDSLVAVMARLRAPGGCPWDREQTPQTLRRYVIEEAYEVVEAVDAGSPAKLCEELGDLSLQVIFQAQLAREAGQFDAGDVTRSIVEKLIRRHPHVFGDVVVADAAQVLTNWEQIKRGEKGYEDRTSILDGIPAGLPALMRALEVSKRVVKVGFEWPTIAEILDKVEEEIAELRAEIAAGDTAKAADELGDLLFTLVNVARQLKVDPEDALRQMTHRFAARFRRIEEHAAAQGRALSDLSLEEMEQVWQEAKQQRVSGASETDD